MEIDTPKKRQISPEERKQIIEELRLVPTRQIIKELMLILKKIHISQMKITND